MHKKLDEKKELLNKLLINHPDIDYSIQEQIDNIIMLQLPNDYYTFKPLMTKLYIKYIFYIANAFLLLKNFYILIFL